MTVVDARNNKQADLDRRHHGALRAPGAACQNRQNHLGASFKSKRSSFLYLYRLPNIEEQQGQERGTLSLLSPEKQLGCAARFRDPNFHFIGGGRE